MFANQVVQQWLQNPTAEGLQLAIFTLEAANLPWTYEYLSFLKKKHEEMEAEELASQQAELAIGAASLNELGGGQQQPGLQIPGGRYEV